MRILITGASGFAGSYLTSELAKDPANTVHATAHGREPGDSKAIQWHVCDLLDSSAVNQLIGSVKPEQIYHLAAYSSPGESFKEPVKAVNDTAAIQINLFEACLRVDIRPRILLVSSGQIYGKSSQMPINEGSAVDCSSPYAVAKLCQENLADYYSKRGFEIVITRPFNHIGPRQQLGFLVADLANQIALAEKSQGESTIKVGNLASKRDFTDVRDIIRAYISLMKNGNPAQVYNVCSGRSVAGQAILDLLIGLAKCPIKVEVDRARMRPSDIPDLYGDHAKLSAATGWQPQIKLAQTLAETLDYWRQQV